MKEYIPKQRKILAIQLTPANINEVQKITKGSIKGTALPTDQQCIDMWIDDEEVRIEMSEWYIQELDYDELVEESVLVDYMFKYRYHEV